MKTGTVVLIGAGGLLLWNAYQTAAFANTVQIVFAGVNVQNLNNIIVRMYVQNITNGAMTFKSMTGNLYLNGEQLASLSSFDERVIPPNSQTEIQMSVSPSLLQLPAIVRNLLSMKGSILNFTAEGNANISGLPILPFSLQETVQL